jgi:pilin isopeptide linkage protein
MRKQDGYRRTAKGAATIMAAALVLAGTIPAFAVENTSTDGGTYTFDRYLIMDQNANVPNVENPKVAAAESTEDTDAESTTAEGTDAEGTDAEDGEETPIFEITAGTAVDADLENGTPQVLAGIDVDKITFSGEDFAPLQTTSSTVLDGDILTLSEGQKYAVQEITVDLSQVTYTEPGIYRYVITENAPTEQGVTIYDDATRILDVYINSDDDGVLSRAGIVMHRSTDVSPATETNNTYDNEDSSKPKPSGFTDLYTTYDLTLKKNVTGNQGDRSRYFEFTVTLSGAEVGTIYNVDLASAQGTVTVDGEEKTNAASLTIGDDQTVTATYYLKHDQSIVIHGLTADTKYSVQEVIDDKDGYTVSYTVDTDADGTVDTTVEDSSDKLCADTEMGDSSDIVEFTNDREGAVPTGVILEVAPYALAVGIAIALLLFLKLRKKA